MGCPVNERRIQLLACSWKEREVIAGARAAPVTAGRMRHWVWSTLSLTQWARKKPRLRAQWRGLTPGLSKHSFLSPSDWGHPENGVVGPSTLPQHPKLCCAVVAGVY
jgi:hypothetical protein